MAVSRKVTGLLIMPFVSVITEHVTPKQIEAARLNGIMITENEPWLLREHSGRRCVEKSSLLMGANAHAAEK